MFRRLLQWPFPSAEEGETGVASASAEQSSGGACFPGSDRFPYTTRRGHAPGQLWGRRCWAADGSAPRAGPSAAQGPGPRFGLVERGNVCSGQRLLIRLVAGARWRQQQTSLYPLWANAVTFHAYSRFKTNFGIIATGLPTRGYWACFRTVRQVEIALNRQ